MGDGWERVRLEELGVNGRVILKRIFDRRDSVDWIWVRIERGDVLL
jgi:hypothetical protein